jgi:hypothetical protein
MVGRQIILMQGSGRENVTRRHGLTGHSLARSSPPLLGKLGQFDLGRMSGPIDLTNPAVEFGFGEPSHAG